MARILFTAQNKQYSYPTTLEDITFDTFLSYLENVLPAEPKQLKTIRQSYIDEIEMRFSVKNLLDSFGLPSTGGPEEIQEYFDWAEQRTIRPSEKLKSEVSKLRDKLAVTRQIREAANKELDQIVYSHQVLPYFARVVSHFTGMPYNLILGMEDYGDEPPMEWRQMEALYWIIVRALEIKAEDYEYKKEVVFEGDTYTLPDRFMENGTVIEFMEAAQFQAGMNSVKNGNWKALLNVTAVLLKKPGEKYGSLVYERNRENFGRLPMRTIVDISFFLLRQSTELNQSTRIFMIAREVARLKRASKDSERLTAGILR